MNQKNQPNPADTPQEEALVADACAIPNRSCQSGRIAVIPPQSTQSCEKVIVALAHQLVVVYEALSMAMETYIYDKHADREDFHDDPFYEAYFSTQEMLRDLAMDWPHLDLPSVYCHRQYE
jgi:hypothetical protein